MSYIGRTGLTEFEERFDTIEEEIDANANYINKSNLLQINSVYTNMYSYYLLS